MSFKMIEPETVDDDTLATSTVPEDDAPEWDALADYPLADPDAPEEVMVTTGSHAIYRAVAASGPSHGGAVNPATDTLNSRWVNIRSTNRWRAFDAYIGDPTVRAESATWVIDAVGLVDSVALFGLAAGTVTIRVEDSTGAVVYEETHGLQDDSGVVDFYTYRFNPIVRLDRLVVTEIPPYFAPRVTITVAAPGGSVEVGQIVLGRQELIGRGFRQVNLGSEDFSQIERDPEFGRLSLMPRDQAGTMALPFKYETAKASYLRRRLLSRSGKLTVFAVDSRFRRNDYAEYGIVTSFQQIADYRGLSEGAIELESIT